MIQMFFISIFQILENKISYMDNTHIIHNQKKEQVQLFWGYDGCGIKQQQCFWVVLYWLIQMSKAEFRTEGSVVIILLLAMSKAIAKKKAAQLQILQTRCIIERLEKLYLVGITGRTSFILQNIKGTKFKITIGNQLKCSCNPNISQQCMHTLHALIEIFYLPIEHPLLYRNTYTDKELRYIIASRRIHDNKVSDFLKYVKLNVGRKNLIIQQEDQDDQDNLCAICHMQIVKCDAVTTCTTVCLNNFHLDCFAQWAKHQMKNNGIVKCPLCRDEKPPQIIREIRQKEAEHKQQLYYKKVGKQYNYYCDGCQLKEIQSCQTVYKCVQCQDVILCEACFKFGRHIRHSFICKTATQKKWRECEDRKGKKKLDSQQGLIRTKLKYSRRLYNFMAATLPCYFSKNTRWNIIECKKLDIKIQELQCIACSDKQKAFLRRLHCGHFIHHRCLRRRIEKGKFYCKQDGQKYLLGYQALLKHEQLNKKAQIQQKDDSQSQQQQKQDHKSPIRHQKSSKSIRTQKTTTSCDSRKKGKKGKHSIEDRNKSLTTKFMINPQ